jgi:hypothetical protein
MSKNKDFERKVQEQLSSKLFTDYDRKRYGAGSQKDPRVDRFSGLDVRKLYGDAEGPDRVRAAAVLDYFDLVKDNTKYGGATETELDRLRMIVGDRPNDNGGSGPGVLPPGEQTYGEPTRPNAFAGSYFDYLGGDPSDPRNYYDSNFLGEDARGTQGIMRNVFDNRTDRSVPVGQGSFLQPLGELEAENEGEEFLRSLIGELGYVGPGQAEGGEVGMVSNEATRALGQLIRGYGT